MKKPDFSPIAGEYARSRPGYPAELFGYLASLVEPRRLAWDCATGNGQAARGLAPHFERVIATDVSDEQIRHAAPHPKIEFRVATSEQSGLGDASADLVSVASALHWFDLEKFYAEARRVTRPGGVVAAWTYHIGHVDPPFDDLFRRFYIEVLFPYFGTGARLVDRKYETVTLPGKRLDPGKFSVSVRWNLDQLLAFIRSWSGTQQYIRERGEDPVGRILEELERLWGDRGRIHTVRWPLYLRVSRL